MSVFADWQPIYEEHRIATFPVSLTHEEKRPAVSNYLRMGLRASRQLAQRFRHADAFGFVLGKKSRITVLDIDTSDESVLADALDRYGLTPILVRSGGGNYQAWYRHNGERRRIRPVPGVPVDILGAGYVVAPPSRAIARDYEIVEGSLDDLDRLPPICGKGLGAGEATKPTGSIRKGERNNALWRFCMRMAHRVPDFDALLLRARNENGGYAPPLSDGEVLKAARSAWDYTERGMNRFCGSGSWLPQQVATLALDPPLCAMVVYLQAQNGPAAEFWIADGLANELRWSRRQFAGARKRAIELGIVRLVRPKAPGRPALYRWGKTCQNW